MVFMVANGKVNYYGIENNCVVPIVGYSLPTIVAAGIAIYRTEPTITREPSIHRNNHSYSY